MTAQRTRHTGYGIWLIIASLAGWWAAFQLTLDKFATLQNPDATLSCNISVFLSCGANLESWQGSAFGFPNPIIGITGWMAVLVMGVAVLAGVRFPRWFWGLFGLGILFSFVFIAWLIGQSFFDLHTLCPWCGVTYLAVVPTSLATLVELGRNGTLSRRRSVQHAFGRLMAWVPLASIVAFAVIVVLAQIAGVDLLGEVSRMLFG
ncbi:vitamin K epoxide reductase family protein [Microbacterium sp. ARD32]|uniref:vitamin K epoxide reductase family protein n=1 Tax=Microbacterium sp. ARD32 TaxID=2962577 RepID=UPI0028823374|nr:vitamin K epoxide reductase family protein [Microbacterium sp. ARD32]MDT0157441.1 vitamin K epoxide reductase family protein [Microbacterium sp. ARD32]